MGQMSTMIFVLSGILVLFYFGGLLGEEASTTNTLLSILLDPESINIGDFLKDNILVVIGGLLIAGGIVGGFALAGNLDLIALASVAGALLVLMMGFVDVFAAVFKVNPIISIIFLSPLIFVMVITTIEWWRGTS